MARQQRGKQPAPTRVTGMSQPGARTQAIVLTGLELEAVKAAVSLATKLAPGAVKAAYRTLTEESVFVQINASWKEREDNHYHIAMTFKNLTEHGIYLEGIRVLKPKTTDTLIEMPRSGRRVHDTGPELPHPDANAPKWVGSDQILPVLLTPGDDPGTWIEVRLPDPGVGEDDPLAVVLGYWYSRLNEASSTPAEMTVRLRRSGPPFRFGSL
jgi:hypothetical protein